IDLGLVDGVRDLEPAERVAEPDGYADLPRKLVRKAGELRSAAGEDDLADGVAARLRLVVGQGRDELAHERLDPAMKDLDRYFGLLGSETLRSDTAVERKAALDGLDLGRAHLEGLCKP